MVKSATRVKKKGPSQRVTKRRDIRSRLGRMTVRQAERFLGQGQEGVAKLRLGSRIRVNPMEDIEIVGDSLICKVNDPSIQTGFARVMIVEKSNRPDGVQFNCDACGTICEHVAATLAEVLESKLILGLSEEPDPSEPIENLTERELVARAIADRKARAAPRIGWLSKPSMCPRPGPITA